jgi:AcrR family transcriptional regulator
MTETRSLRQERPPRKRRSDGERSRNAILNEAAHLATVEGIEGLSISRLADAVGMSKSGLFAHFGSKEELQLATIETARATFNELVVEPALAAPTGLERLQQLTDKFLHYVDKVYPGGCFFASVSAEMDTRPGPVRDRTVELQDYWHKLLEHAVRDAQAEGDLSAAEEPEQLAFELNSFLYLANSEFVVTGKPLPLERGRRAITSRIAAAADGS